MAFELSRIDRLTRTVDLAAKFPNLDGPFTAAEVALLPPRGNPSGATEWATAGVTDGIATVLFAGPDADSSGAVVVTGSADLWVRVTEGAEVDAVKIERITLLGGGTVSAPGPLPQVLTVQGRTGAVVLDADDVGVPDAISDTTSATGVALRAALVPFWTAAEVLTAGKVRMAPDGHVIQRIADGTARSSYDATEQALWNIIGGGSGSFTVDGAPPADGTLNISSTAVTAADIGFTPTSTIAATTVQAAIAEAASEAIPTSQKGANSGVATLDASGQVPASQLGNATGGAAADSWMGYAATTLSASSSASVVGAGNLFFARVTRGSKSGATKVGVYVAVSSGNIMVGIYASTGSGSIAQPGALKGSSIVTPCPTAGYSEISLQAATDVAIGDYLALWCDNLTATFAYLGNTMSLGSPTADRAVGCYNPAGTGITSLPAGPLASGALNGYGRLYQLRAV